MPYSNVPKVKTNKMDKCVASVKSSNPTANPYTICYSSIVKNLKKNYKKQYGRTNIYNWTKNYN